MDTHCALRLFVNFYAFHLLRFTKYTSTNNCGMHGVQSAIKMPKHKPLTNSTEMTRFCAHAHHHRVPEYTQSGNGYCLAYIPS
jgi:hypothetical protein